MNQDKKVLLICLYLHQNYYTLKLKKSIILKCIFFIWFFKTVSYLRTFPFNGKNYTFKLRKIENRN